MRFLVIGGTQLSGPFLVRDLLRRGHHVTIFHRGNHPQNVPPAVNQILAPSEMGEPSDRLHLRAFADEFRRVKPDVVIHMMAFIREDAAAFVSVFKGLAGRAVVASSSDVYRVMGIINGTEPGPPIPVPLTEDAPLRQLPSIHGARSEKRDVEQVVLSEPALPTCVLRYPAIYGPGSYRHHDWIKRMLDARPAILISRGHATFRWSHSYAEDIGAATALAAVNDRSAGRIYNVGEPNALTERKRLEDFARIAGWSGRIVEVDDDEPYHGQDWLLDTTRIRSELGFAEVSDYDQGIRDTIEWQQRHPNPAMDPKDFDYGAEDQMLARL